MRWASSGLARPETTTNRLLYSSSSDVAGWLAGCSTLTLLRSVGRAPDGLPADSTLCPGDAFGVALDVRLARPGDAQRAVGDVLRDHRPGAGVDVVADR